MNANLPGVMFHISDNKRTTVINEPITDTVLIIGTAVDGPINKPIRVSARSASQIFGPMAFDKQYPSASKGASGDPNIGKYNGNDLIKAFNDVVLGGCSDAILIRVGDTTHTLYAAPAGTGATLATLLGITLNALCPGAVYNGLKATLTYSNASAATGASATLTIDQSVIGKGRVEVYDLLNKTTGAKLTKQELIDKINQNTRNSTVWAQATSDTDDLTVALPFTGSGTQVYTYAGGKDGTRRNDYASAADMYTALIGSPEAGELFAADSPFGLLESLEADIVTLSCLYADENISDSNTPMTIAIPFAKALYNASVEQYPMIGVLGVKPLGNPTQANANARIAALTQEYTGVVADAMLDGDTTMLKLGYFTSLDPATEETQFAYTDPYSGDRLDTGHYIQICAAPDTRNVNAAFGNVSETWAWLYAGLLSALPPDRAATNLRVPGVKSVGYTLTNRQLNRLVGGQPWDSSYNLSGGGGSYVTLHKGAGEAFVVTLDNTCALRTSDFAEYHKVNISNMVASGIKRVVQTFIGMGANQATMQALNSQVKDFFESVVVMGAIEGGKGIGYDFEIAMDANDQIFGRVRIPCYIRPVSQIKKIVLDITVAPPLG